MFSVAFFLISEESTPYFWNHCSASNLLSIPVEGEIDPIFVSDNDELGEMGHYGYENLYVGSRYKCCISNKVRERLPDFFSRDFYFDVLKCVILTDPNGNKLEVCVLRKIGRVYFTEGWTRIGLEQGGWIRMEYISKTDFIIEALKRCRTNTKYPNPKQRFNLQAIDVAVNAAPHDEQILSHIMDKRLTAAQVKASKLALYMHAAR